MAIAVKVRPRDAKNNVYTRIVFAFILLVFSFCKIYSQQLSTCSGSPFNYLLPNEPNGTTYTWTAPVITPSAGAITGGVAQAALFPVRGNDWRICELKDCHLSNPSIRQSANSYLSRR